VRNYLPCLLVSKQRPGKQDKRSKNEISNNFIGDHDRHYLTSISVFPGSNATCCHPDTSTYKDIHAYARAYINQHSTANTDGPIRRGISCQPD
jgi:hypothetical protein